MSCEDPAAGKGLWLPQLFCTSAASQLSTDTHVGQTRNGTLDCHKSGHRWETLVFTDRHRRQIKGLAHSD